MSSCVNRGIQVGGLFTNGSKQECVEPYVHTMVSEDIYYCDYFVFGNICMFLTSFYAHFCILCAQLVGEQ